MDVEVIEDKKNPLLKRREVKFRLKFAGATPSREDVRGKLVALLNSDKKLTVLDYVKSDYGRQAALGYAKVYDDTESMGIEPEYKVKRNFEAKKAPAEEGQKAASESKPAEKAGEDKKPNEAEKKEGE